MRIQQSLRRQIRTTRRALAICGHALNERPTHERTGNNRKKRGMSYGNCHRQHKIGTIAEEVTMKKINVARDAEDFSSPYKVALIASHDEQGDVHISLLSS